MHVDAAHHIPMPSEVALPMATHPLSASGPLVAPACRTLARRSPFRASEAHDAGLLALVRQIVDVFAIFPLGHALMMVPSCWAIAHPMGIANVENPDLLGLTEMHDFAGAFVPQVAHLPLDAGTHLPAGSLQLAPAS